MRANTIANLVSQRRKWKLLQRSYYSYSSLFYSEIFVCGGWGGGVMLTLLSFLIFINK